MIKLTKIKEIDNIIYSYVKDLELWDTYEYAISLLKLHIKSLYLTKLSFSLDN